MRLASHIHQPLTLTKHTTSSTQFIRWMIYLDDEEVKPPTRVEQYLARIALEIQRTINPKKSKNLKIKDFLLSFVFKSKNDARPTGEMSHEAKKRALAMNKAMWGMAVGVMPPAPKKEEQ